MSYANSGGDDKSKDGELRHSSLDGAKTKNEDILDFRMADSTKINDYQTKLQELQKYVHFLESNIRRLKADTREAQISKLQNLVAKLSDTKIKLKFEELKQCEEGILKLYNRIDELMSTDTMYKFKCRMPSSELSETTLSTARQELNKNIESTQATCNPQSITVDKEHNFLTIAKVWSLADNQTSPFDESDNDQNQNESETNDVYNDEAETKSVEHKEIDVSNIELQLSSNSTTSQENIKNKSTDETVDKEHNFFTIAKVWSLADNQTTSFDESDNDQNQNESETNDVYNEEAETKSVEHNEIDVSNIELQLSSDSTISQENIKNKSTDETVDKEHNFLTIAKVWSLADNNQTSPFDESDNDQNQNESETNDVYNEEAETKSVEHKEIDVSNIELQLSSNSTTSQENIKNKSTDETVDKEHNFFTIAKVWSLADNQTTSFDESDNDQNQNESETNDVYNDEAETKSVEHNEIDVSNIELQLSSDSTISQENIKNKSTDETVDKEHNFFTIAKVWSLADNQTTSFDESDDDQNQNETETDDVYNDEAETKSLEHDEIDVNYSYL